MKLTIELSEEEIRALIAFKVANEASKHGHPNDVERKISVVTPNGVGSLADLKVSVIAEIEIAKRSDADAVYTGYGFR